MCGKLAVVEMNNDCGVLKHDHGLVASLQPPTTRPKPGAHIDSFVLQSDFVTNGIPGYPEICEWPILPSRPLRISDFGIYRDPAPHCTMYVDLVDSDGNEFNFFFDRFLGRLCFGKTDDDEKAAFLKKGSQIQKEAFEIIKNLCDGPDEYVEIKERLELASNYI